jgi:hypothetical protein
MVVYLFLLQDLTPTGRLGEQQLFELDRARKNIITLDGVTVTAIGEDLSVEKQAWGRLTL